MLRIIPPPKMSINIPNNTPNAVPIFAPEYKPINSINIINRFGITPAIVNELKKFDCRKYIIINAMISIIIVITFFIIHSYYLRL